MRFDGKVAFVTGGAVGIGRAFAEAIAAEGASVAIADIDEPAALAAAEELRAQGASAVGLCCDVADRETVEQAAAAAARELGGIDVLLNNAAKHLLDWNRPVTELPVEKWRTLLDVNVIGVVNSAAACRPHLRDGGGVILNMSSIAGFQSVASYGITKLAVRGLTVALASEFADDAIRVVGVAPGATETPALLESLPPERIEHFVNLQLIKRRGQIDDLIGPMLFLCSEEAGFVTGETLIIGGGFPLRV